jgi:SAM-dependent methyltransferase
MDDTSDTAIINGVQQAYDAHAPLFAVATSTMPDQVALLGKQVLAALPPDGWLLDAGCGTGRDMAWFEAQGVSVIGADRSPAMLTEARSRVHGPLVRMDLQALALGREQACGVWCNAALLHLPPHLLPAALGELRRVGVPGGVVAITLQLGVGAGWETGRFGRRFFARYQTDAVMEHLHHARLRVRFVREWLVGTRRWLHLACEV